MTSTWAGIAGTFLAAAIAKAKAQILEDVQAGEYAVTGPNGVKCFADLHNHIDANTLGGLADDDFPLEGEQQIEFGNALQSALDRWIREGGFSRWLEAANGKYLTVGELRRFLAGFPEDLPVTVAKPEAGDWFNVVGASNPYDTGEPSLVLQTRDDFHLGQF